MFHQRYLINAARKRQPCALCAGTFEFVEGAEPGVSRQGKKGLDLSLSSEASCAQLVVPGVIEVRKML